MGGGEEFQLEELNGGKPEPGWERGELTGRWSWETGVLAVVVGIVIGGCGPKYPEWFRNPPMDSSRYYYGIGSGESELEAIKKGVLEIAQKIETEVTGEVGFQQRYHNGKVDLRIIQSSLQRLPLLTLFNLPVLKRGYSRGYYFVLIRLDRFQNRELLYKKGVQQLDLIDKLIYGKVPLSRSQIEDLIAQLQRKVLPALELAQLFGKETTREIKRAHFYQLKLLKMLKKSPPSLWKKLRSLF
ncbi:MAG: LPP20 family lipoprotein [Campylobacterales bacterium]